MLEDTPTTGAIQSTTAEKVRLASLSRAFCQRSATLREVFADQLATTAEGEGEGDEARGGGAEGDYLVLSGAAEPTAPSVPTRTPPETSAEARHDADSEMVPRHTYSSHELFAGESVARDAAGGSAVRAGEISDLEQAGNQRVRRGLYDAAYNIYAQAADRARGDGDSKRLAVILSNLSLCSLRVGDVEGSRKHVRPDVLV